MSSGSDDVEAHLAGVCGLNLALDSVQLPPEPVLGARVQHLAPHLRRVRRPGNQVITPQIQRSKISRGMQFNVKAKIN